jgi:uncharacterized membrane protein
MTRYELFLFVHVVASILWLGAGIALGLAAFKVHASGDPGELRALASLNEWLGPRLFAPSAVAVFASGLALALDGPWSLGSLWIVLGLAGYGASFLVNAVVRQPAIRRIRAANRARGPGNPEAARQGRRLLLVSRVELVMLVLVVADMVVKPTADDLFPLIAGGAVLLVAAAAAVRAGVRKPSPTGAAAATARPA